MAATAPDTTKSTPAAPEPKVVTGKIDNFTPPAPTSKRGGGVASKYPFDSLGVGEFFSVANRDRKAMQNPVRYANKRFRTETKAPDGSVVNTSQEREFYAVEVDADTAKRLKGTPHEGATTLVVRKK